MAIGTDELDDFNDIDEFEPIQDDPEPSVEPQDPDEPVEDPSQEPSNKDDGEDFIVTLLKSRGIEDMSKIKFEDEEGTVEEKDWNSLSNEEKLNILSYSDQDSNTDLDDNEVQLINAIRESGLTPAEYIQKLQTDGINSYIQNNQTEAYQYQVDQLDDDELFVYDFMSRMGDVTQEEAQEALERAKSNESLFAKQIGAIRKEYKEAEDESIRQAQMEEEAQAQERYDQFANQIAEQVDSLSDFSGYDLNMDDEDKEMLYDFIVGVDGAGNNYFAKALSDPKILVRTAWLALNGEQMIHDITEYFQKEISSVRKESYDKGKADAQKKDKPDVVYKNKPVGTHNDVYDDLD